MAQQRVLIVDDEDNMRHMLMVLLSKVGYAVIGAADGVEGLQRLEESDFDFILCDIKMPRMDGMTFLQTAREKYPEKTYIMMSAYGNIETALEAMKEGTAAAISAIQDTDYAEETANLDRQDVLLQAAVAMLARANSSQLNVLSLLR